VLHYFRLTGAFINIEIKVTGIARDVVALVKQHRLVERTIVSSFLHDQVAVVKKLCRGIAGGVLCSDRIVDPSHYVRKVVGGDIFSPSRGVFQPAKGVGVHVYTVNDPREMKRFIDGGATGVFTDYPERLVRVLSQRGGSGV
jgi:glycerophosphoryl diester phosphodiesterase